MTNKKVAIIGAGFSGLTLAWALTKQGFQVDVFESADHCGGLLGTDQEIIPVEKAANALLASRSVENLFSDLNVKIVEAGYRSKKRYIFKNKPVTFPIPKLKAAMTLVKAVIFMITKKIAPKKNEMVSEWATRCLSSDFNDYLVSPGFQGIYGQSSDQLSAELVMGGVFNKALRPAKGKLKGSITPEAGMRSLIDPLQKYLKEKNVQFHLSTSTILNEKDFSAVVIATSIDKAVEILAAKAPLAAQTLVKVPTLPLVTATLGFRQLKSIQGFGCLFPAKENFNSLGVLFNTDIFPNRGHLESETWILNKNENILDLILADRKKMLGSEEKPQFFKITKYQKALPLYGLELRDFLLSDSFTRSEAKNLFEVFKNGARLKESAQPLYLTGNYLGGVGLAKILDYNLRLTERIKKDIA
ncbi:MAG: NAD(P)-binding protein [Bdellovibrio sp.]|nr:NAD(P)-binding protein [Bdellovibrio sp.]